MIDTISGLTINPEAILQQVNDFVDTLEERLGFNFFTPENLAVIPRAGSNILQVLGNSVYSFVINIVVILFVLYYMLFSNDEFERAISEILPFKEENKQILAEETRLIIQANAIGIPLMAIIQGFFAYFGYLLFGVESAILYAILTAFATILPIVGTMIIWAPLSIGMMIGGDLVNGIGLFFYGFFIIGGVDNVARFILQKKLADIHPLITVFGVLIGIPMFGFWGVIFGPLILSLFILFFNMYRHEYVPGSKAEPRVTTRLRTKKMKIPMYDSVAPKKKKGKRKMSLKTNNAMRILLFLSIVLFASACNMGRGKLKEASEHEYVSSEEIRHAQGFKIDHAEDYTRVTILNPWSDSPTSTKAYETYYLYKNDSILPTLPDNGVKLKIPIESLTVNTFSYFEFLEQLNELEVITGVTDGFRIYHPEILHKIETGAIVDLGDPFQPDIERTMALRPQAIVNSAYAQLDRYSERLLQAGFPVIYSLEWMETTAGSSGMD